MAHSKSQACDPHLSLFVLNVQLFVYVNVLCACFALSLCMSVCSCVLCSLCLYVGSGSARPWMDSLEPETLYVASEQAGLPTLPVSNSEVSTLGG